METNEQHIVDENAQVDPFEEVSNKSVRQTLNHQIKRPIASYIKQFVDNKLINPDASKDIEDVIRVYWGLQDVAEMSAYRINPMQQRIGEIFSKNPGLIKKLHYCRSFFTQQQLRYTKAVQAIQKISKYSMFTTEYDSDTIVPVLGEKMAWGQTSGIADKQICVLVASADASWIKTIASPDDVKLINYLQKMFGTVSMADNLTLITSKMPMSMNKSQLFNEKTYSARISVAKPDRANEKVPSTEKYDVIYGDPFSIMDTIARSKVMDNNPYRYRGNKQQKNQPNNDDSIHTGIVSKYGLIECHSFSTDYYRDVMDEYVKSSKLREDNVQLYEHIWARFNVQYEQLLTSMVDRAIMVAHQTMVDFLISVYEQKFSIPQLMMFYSPGTMIKIKTDYEVNQCAMVLNSYVDNSNGESSLTLSVLNPNTTKEQHIMIHDTNIGTMAKSKPGYGISIINGGTRSGSIFNYYTTSASVDLMLDTDIDKQLAFSKMCIKMAITPQHMEIDGNYYWSEHVYGPETDTKQTPYKGRVMVDYVHTRSGFSDFDKNVIISKHDLKDVYELATVDYFKNKTVYPGGIDNEGSSNILLTGDKFLSDIRLMLSLPVMASAMILKDKRWGLVKVLDLKDVEYHPEAYDQLVMDENIKETLKIVTENQDKNTFRDIIGGKESGCIYLLAGDPGCGKMGLNTDPIKIPGGWTTYGKVKVGDIITSVDGGTTEVDGVFPKGLRTVYRVSFADGRFVDVGDEHLWEVLLRSKSKKRGYFIKSVVINTLKIKELLERPSLKNRMYIPLCESEQIPDVDLPIDPYLLGVLIGDGCLRGTSLVAYTDSDIIHRVQSRNPGLTVHMTQAYKNCEYNVKAQIHVTGDGLKLRYNLKSLGLWDKLSYYKFIPEMYLNASHEQRLELLRGLCDTDGCVGDPTKSTGRNGGSATSGVVEYSTSSEQLSKDVQKLVWSLGGKCRVTSRIPYYTNAEGKRVPGKTSYRVYVKLKNPKSGFSLERKQCRLAETHQYTKYWKLGIVSVDQLFEQQECTCISVTDPRHLYVTKDYIVTHNTLTAEAIAEKLHKPLYQVSAGELGSWDGKIESSLKRILDQAQRWNAIVLMDEADTFLYKRTDGSIERNAVVSTFLRQLEYFNGTMFLTSNRADDIDPAFMSRILQCIKFVSLTEDERATVWKGLVAKQGVTLTDEQASTLAKFNVNGRQIKNVIKVAIALSLGAKKDLSFDTINETAASMHSGKTLTNKGFEK